MDIQQIKDILNPLGTLLSTIVQKTIVGISSLGIKTTELQSKIITITIIAFIIFIIAKFIEFAKKPLKWIIIILLTVLIISVIFTF